MRFFSPSFPVFLLLCAPALPSVASTLTVQPGQSIQSAVNAANPGDTVLVKGGTYTESVLIATNSNGVPLNGLSLVGTNGATLNGPNVEPINGITVGASNVTIKGLTVEHYDFGIVVTSTNNPLNNTVTVSNTRIFNNYVGYNLNSGIFFDSDVAGADCHDNVITGIGVEPGGNGGNNGFGDGIDINVSTGVHIHSNLIYNENSVGIGSSGQVLTDNNGQPIPSSVNLINQNTIFQCGAYGIMMNGAVGQVVTQNVISGNNIAGILMTNFCATCTINNNVLDGNTYDGVYLDAGGATQSTFGHNSADYNGHDGFEVTYAPILGSNFGNVFSYDEAQANKNFDAEDVSPKGTNTWTHDQFDRTNPPNLGK